MCNFEIEMGKFKWPNHEQGQNLNSQPSAISSPMLSTHSQDSCEWVDHDLQVIWVELERIKILQLSWLFGFRPCL